MAWSAPKTDWDSSDGVTDTDLNRIEENISVHDHASGVGGTLGADSVNSAAIADDAVVEDRIADDAVTLPKRAQDYRLSVYQNPASAQTIPNAIWTRVNLGLENWDINNNWVTNQLVNSGQIIYWDVKAAITFVSNANGSRRSALYKNGALVKRGNVIDNPGFGNETMQVTSDTFVDGDDFVELYVFQNSGGDLNLIPDSEHTWLTAHGF